MRKLFCILTAAVVASSMLFMTGCGKKEYKSAEVIKDTTQNIADTWTTEDGQKYTFNSDYTFSGSVDVDGTVKDVSGKYTLVTDEVSQTVTITISADDLFSSYICEGQDTDTMTLTDNNSDEIITLNRD